MDTTRIPPTADGVAITVGQIRDLATRLENTSRDQQAPTFVFDAGYDPVALTHQLADVAATIVVRIRDDRVFYSDPPPATGKVGRPRRHGERRGCAEPGSWPAPDHQTSSSDDRYGTVHVAAWHDLHPKLGARGRWPRLRPAPDRGWHHRARRCPAPA